MGGRTRDKGEGDVPSFYQLMFAYKDRSRHLAGETLLFYGGTTYGSDVIPKKNLFGIFDVLKVYKVS